MRSSPSRPDPRPADPLHPGPVGFAHRGRHGPFPFVENSLTAFAACLEMGAGVECDVRLTKDGRIVIFHDSDTARICGRPGIVEQSTLAELQHLSVGNHPIPTLEQLLALVEGKSPVLVELKFEGLASRWMAPLGKAIAGYRGRIGIMSFSPALMGWVRHKLPDVRRGWVVKDSLGPVTRWWGMRFAQPHFLAVETHAAGRRWAQRARRRLPLYSWTVKSAADRKRLEPLVDALIWEGDGRP